MKSFSILALVATALTAITQTFAAPDPNFHIYLAFGQSNMEGQGTIEPQDKIVDERFQMLSTVGGCNGRELGQWYDATPPLASCWSRIGPSDYFGRTLVEKLPKEIKIGIVVVAVGGCDIQLFEKDNYKSYRLEPYMEGTVESYGGNPYGRLIDMAKKAQEVGVIKGILLHQGETNNGQKTWPQRVKAIYDDMLETLNLKAEDVPLLAGEVVTTAVGGLCGGMNSIIDDLPNTIPTAHVISAEGLEQQGDGYHFSTEAYRTFGARYAEEMLKILGDVKPVSTETPDAPADCWSQSLGYPCCTDETTVAYTDADGQWGIQNKKWCGKPNSNNKNCWAESLGYKCCSTSACRNVRYSDVDGQWDVENGKWCGISTVNTLC